MSATLLGAAETAVSLLAIGVEAQGVRICLLEPVAGQYRLVGWLGLQADGSMETPQLVASACRRLGQRLGRTLWDERKQEPFLDGDEPIRMPPLAHVAVSLAARRPLALWLAAVSRTLSLAALENAVSGVPVQVVGHSLLTADLDPTTLAAALSNGRVEALVVAGGFDDPAPSAQQPILALCRHLHEALAALAPDRVPALFYAGNRFAVDAVSSLFAGSEPVLPMTIVGNVQPSAEELKPHELQRVLGYYDWRLSERLPGYSRLSRWVTSPGQVSALAITFAQLTRLWLEQQQLAELHAVYTTAAWRLHVLAEAGQGGVRQHFLSVKSRSPALESWPPIQLVSGPQVGEQLAARFWWDREGLAPIIGALGQVAPLALVQTLSADLFQLWRGENL